MSDITGFGITEVSVPFQTSSSNILTPPVEPPKEAGDEMKKDYGKAGWHLLPYDALRGIVKVLDFGAKKYSARGWEAGMDYSRVFAALQRHLVSWWNKEGVDSDTGYSHLWHAGCCILFLIAYELRGVGRDDRP